MAAKRGTLVPPQHGAWGFLALPVALGIAAGGWTWAAAPVVLAWVALYPWSWALTNRLAAPRPERFARPLVIWSVVAVPLAAASVVLFPWLLLVGLAYLVPFAVNVAYARARRERDLANDLVLVAECVVAVPVVAALPGSRGDWALPADAMTTSAVAALACACALTLVGSTLHVKSLIRERANPAFTRLSRAFALLGVPVAAGVAVATGTGAVLVLAFVALALRALFLHDPTWRPARIGILELVGLVLVVVLGAVAVA